MGLGRTRYVAARFAGIYAQTKPCQVRLVKGDFPDFEIMCDSQVTQFELAEADKLGRRRGAEYKQKALKKKQGIKLEPVFFSPDEEESSALPAIQEIIRQKAAKNYTPPPHLLLYVNFMLFRALPFSKEELVGLVIPWRDKFASIWILWDGNLVQCWPNYTHIIAADAATDDD